jgi:SLOG family YspA-like protein
MRRVLVCGDRHWRDNDLLICELNSLLSEDEMWVIAGGARGADTLAVLWALGRGCGYTVFPAEWDRYGKAAGPRRNAQMLDEGKPDLVIAFHDNIEASRGTKDMVKRAKRAGVPIVVIGHGNPGTSKTIIGPTILTEGERVTVTDPPDDDQPTPEEIAEEQADQAAENQAKAGGTAHPGDDNVEEEPAPSEE